MTVKIVTSTYPGCRLFTRVSILSPVYSRVMMITEPFAVALWRIWFSSGIVTCNVIFCTKIPLQKESIPTKKKKCVGPTSKLSFIWNYLLFGYFSLEQLFFEMFKIQNLFTNKITYESGARSLSVHHWLIFFKHVKTQI